MTLSHLAGEPSLSLVLLIVLATPFAIGAAILFLELLFPGLFFTRREDRDPADSD